MPWSKNTWLLEIGACVLECVACVYFTFGIIFLLIAFFMALGFLMGALIISFEQPIDLYKSLWLSKNG